MNINKLPNELIEQIYDYDGRYHSNYKKVVNNIKTLNDWKNFQKNHFIELLQVNQWIMSFEEKVYHLKIIDDFEKYGFYYYYFNKFHKFNYNF